MAVGVERGSLNLTQAAEYLSVKRRWLREQGVRKYKIPYVRAPGSKQLLFLPSDLDAWLKANRQDKGTSKARRRSK